MPNKCGGTAMVFVSVKNILIITCICVVPKSYSSQNKFSKKITQNSSINNTQNTKTLANMVVEYTENGYIAFLEYHSQQSDWIYNKQDSAHSSAQLIMHLPIYKNKGINLGCHEGKAIEIALEKKDFFLLHQLLITFKVDPDQHSLAIIETLVALKSFEIVCHIIFATNLTYSQEYILQQIAHKIITPELGLFMAVSRNFYQTAEHILENYQVAHNHMSFALNYGAGKHTLELVELLVEHGATLNSNQTLICNAFSPSTHTCNALCTHTILDIAVHYNNIDVVNYVLTHGITAKNNGKIIGKAFTNISASKTQLLTLLAQAGALVDNYGCTLSQETTNLALALNQPDDVARDFILQNIPDLSSYTDILIEAAGSPYTSLETLEKIKEKPGVNFENTKDRCLIITASLKNPKKEIIRYLLEHGANPTEGLKWYLYNLHEKHCPLYLSYKANSDQIYQRLLDSQDPDIQQLITLARYVLPQNYTVIHTLLSYAYDQKALQLLHTIIKKIIEQELCIKTDFEPEKLISLLMMVAHIAHKELKNFAQQCASEEFIEYSKNRNAYTKKIIASYQEHVTYSYIQLKKICWWACIFDHQEILTLMHEQLGADLYTNIVNERSTHGFTAISYAAQWGNRNIVAKLITLTQKKSDITVAAIVAQKYAPMITYMLYLYCVTGKIQAN